MPIDIDGLSYEELVQLDRRIVERLKMLQAVKAHVDMMAFNLGARVRFDSQDGRQLGILVKYNRKTVTVLTDDGQQWRVSPSLLSPVKDAGEAATHDQQPNEKNDCADQYGSIAVSIERYPLAGV
jgi:hypothetical protein